MIEFSNPRMFLTKLFNESIVFLKNNAKQEVIATIIILTVLFIRSSNSKIKHKNILVIGGTKGLGLEIAVFLEENNKIAISGRKNTCNPPVIKRFKSPNSIKYIQLDITSEFKKLPKSFDYIFCCPGICTPKFFADSEIQEFESTLNTNYLGVVKTLKYFQKYNSKPFTFVAVSSTVGFLTFPGYCSYSPTKCALINLFESLRPEMSKNIKLKLFICGNMLTESYENENKIKPELTKQFEGDITPFSPKKAAEMLIKQIHNRNNIPLGWFDYLVTIRRECECVSDYILFPIAIIVIFFAKIRINKKFY